MFLALLEDFLKRVGDKMKKFLGALNGFRKLFICILVVILATAFLISGHLDGKMYTSIMTITVPSYFAGNIGEHLTSSVKDFLKGKLKKDEQKS